jgi:pterin-4a-carbinolamine dehydratase
VDVGYYTYPAGGLTLNDFIMAAKINERRYNE